MLGMAALICAAEYPCFENGARRNDHITLANCNALFRRYDACLYFLIVTFSTVGYGDMYPATTVGRAVRRGVVRASDAATRRGDATR